MDSYELVPERDLGIIEKLFCELVLTIGYCQLSANCS
jgi:hypothetical protein